MKRTNASIWILSVAILALGYLFICRPLEEQVNEVDRTRGQTVAEIDRNVAIARDAAALGHQYDALRARTAAVDLSDDSVRLVAVFIREATAVARASHVRITGFDGRPLTRAATAPIGRATPVPSAFSATTIELTVEGSYAHLITGLRQLSHQRVPVRVEVASIERTADPQQRREPLLDARIRVDILYRTTAKAAHASAS
jgi:hypothetical protein